MQPTPAVAEDDLQASLFVQTVELWGQSRQTACSCIPSSSGGGGTVQLSRTGAVSLGCRRAGVWVGVWPEKPHSLSQPPNPSHPTGTFMGTPPSTTSGARNPNRQKKKKNYVPTCPEWCTATSTCPPDSRLTEYRRRRRRSTGLLVKVSRDSPRLSRCGRHTHGCCQRTFAARYGAVSLVDLPQHRGLSLGGVRGRWTSIPGVTVDSCSIHTPGFVGNSYSD